MLPDWIYTADPALFEIRQAVKRKNASYFRDVAGVDMPDFEDEDALEKFETLKMISAARDIVNAAQKVESELVHQARSQGIQLKEIGRLLEMGEAGVSNYLKRNPVAPERQIEITRELEAWSALNWLWGREGKADDPGEATFLYGVDRLLTAHRKFDEAIKLGSGGGAVMASSDGSLSRAIECFGDPKIPGVIAKYASRAGISGKAEPNVIPDAGTAYVRHGIIGAILAKMALRDSLRGSSGILQSGIYMTWALVSLSRPEAMFVSDGMIEFLRREHPYLLLSESGIPMDQITKMIKRKFNSES
jgi:hypothetical protein